MHFAESNIRYNMISDYLENNTCVYLHICNFTARQFVKWEKEKKTLIAPTKRSGPDNIIPCPRTRISESETHKVGIYYFNIYRTHI